MAVPPSDAMIVVSYRPVRVVFVSSSIQAGRYELRANPSLDEVISWERVTYV
jgi:protein involved in polysaccharide export with SLBB domain